MTDLTTRPRLLAVVGPTASGKSALAEALADALGAHILSVDSMQVYEHLDVGTAKPSAAVRARIPHHGLDLVQPHEQFDAAAFAAYAKAAIAGATAQGRPVIACGGTGFYLRALIDGLSDAPPRDEGKRAALRAERDALGIGALYARLQGLDPVAAARIHPNDWVRIERALEVVSLTGRPFSGFLPASRPAPAFDALYLGLCPPRDLLYQRVDARLVAMWEGGLQEEAARWVAPLPPEAPPARALGYQHALMALRGEVTEAEALALAQRDTRRFARRQLIWFCAMPQVRWLQPSAPLDGGAAGVRALAEAVRGWLVEGQPWAPPQALPWTDNPRRTLDA